MPLKEKTVVTIEKDGYEPALVTVAKKVSKKWSLAVQPWLYLSYH